MARAGACASGRQRLRLRVRGAVQGVGFRPFAYGLASRLKLSRFRAQRRRRRADRDRGVAGAGSFVDELRSSAAAAARIDSIEVVAIAPTGDERLRDRCDAAGPRAHPDRRRRRGLRDCLEELFDPASRFYGYPLINCTHCGPRYTLTRALPYDRAQTSMAPFAMCDGLRARLSPIRRTGASMPSRSPARAAGRSSTSPSRRIAARIAAGGIVALKGLGGFHLMCDARDEAAVARLRRARRARQSRSR